MGKDNFGTYHPIINFVYFVFVIGCSMFLRHPVFLGISCVSGFIYYIYLKGKKAFKTALWLMIPVFLISALVNPLFNHEGVTLLFYFRTGNPLTLESIVYGMASGVMLVSVLNWFSCYQVIMTSDKFISDAQKCIGRDVTNGNTLTKAKHGMKILSIMTTWALENSVETADSMKSRGYGLRGRTNFSIYRFDTRDKWIFSVIAAADLIVLGGIVTKKVYFLYFPMMEGNPLNWETLLIYVIYGGMCMLPMVINIVEDIKWHYLKSEI